MEATRFGEEGRDVLEGKREGGREGRNQGGREGGREGGRGREHRRGG
jgi:hypothetical protein